MLNPKLKDLDVSSEELNEIAKLLARKRVIKVYESMPEDRLLSAFISSKPVKKASSQKQEQKRSEKKLRNYNMSFLNQKYRRLRKIFIKKD